MVSGGGNHELGKPVRGCLSRFRRFDPQPLKLASGPPDFAFARIDRVFAVIQRQFACSATNLLPLARPDCWWLRFLLLEIFHSSIYALLNSAQKVSRRKFGQGAVTRNRKNTRPAPASAEPPRAATDSNSVLNGVPGDWITHTPPPSPL